MRLAGDSNSLREVVRNYRVRQDPTARDLWSETSSRGRTTPLVAQSPRHVSKPSLELPACVDAARPPYRGLTDLIAVPDWRSGAKSLSLYGRSFSARSEAACGPGEAVRGFGDRFGGLGEARVAVVGDLRGLQVLEYEGEGVPSAHGHALGAGLLVAAVS